MTFADRLNAAMRASGHTQASLAEAVGMAQPSVWKLTQGITKNTRKFYEIAKVLEVSPEWLSSGEGEMRGAPQIHIPKKERLAEPDYYRVDVLDVQASAGDGYLVSTEFVETIRAIEYTNEQAKALFGPRPADTIKVITVRGDSMEGTIEPGDQIFVDLAVTHFDGDGVYVFVFGKTMHVKRLQMQKHRLAVLSDNQRYKEWFIEESDEGEFHIMAKVLLRQSVDYKRLG